MYTPFSDDEILHPLLGIPKQESISPKPTKIYIIVIHNNQ